MIPLRTIAYPKVWDRQKKDFIFISVASFSLASLLLVSAVFGGRVDLWILSLSGIGISVLSVSFTFWTFFRIKWPRIENRRIEHATFVVRKNRIVTLAWACAAGLVVPLFSILTVEGRSAFGRLPPEGTLRGWLARVIVQAWPGALILLAILIVGYAIGRIITRGARIGIGMDAAGIYHWWWAGCSFFPWREISDIQLMRQGAGPVVRAVAGRYDYSANPAETRIGRMVLIRRWNRRLSLRFLRTHPGLVYQAMFFYLRNPELRDELEDERSVERMQRRDYGKIPLEIDTHGRALSPEEAAAK